VDESDEEQRLLGIKKYLYCTSANPQEHTHTHKTSEGGILISNGEQRPEQTWRNDRVPLDERARERQNIVHAFLLFESPEGEVQNMSHLVVFFKSNEDV
jgi:hypothetical protein